MSAQQARPPDAQPDASTHPPGETQESGWTFQRTVTVATIGFVAVVFLPFIAALILALATEGDRPAEIVRILRDISIIVLSLVGIVVVLSLSVLILQIAQLIHLLQHEIRPVLDDLQSTANVTRKSVQFVGENVARPVIRATAFTAGLKVFLKEFGGIRKAMRRQPPATPSPDDQKES